MSALTTLLIGSDQSLIKSVRKVVHSIGTLGFDVVAGTGEAFSRLERDDVVLLLAHLDAARDRDGIASLIRTLADRQQCVPIVALSDGHSAEQELELLRLGAADYLSRPLDLNRLGYLVDTLTLRGRFTLRQPSSCRAPQPAPMQTLGVQESFLYSESTEMGRMVDQVRSVAPLDSTVLLSGETGTGKTHLARLIHELSPRTDFPFLVVNCGALSSSLIESELFGHVRGAFTGADRDRVGKLEEVGRGTLLLDDVDALPPPLQSKLLRVVEERVFEPVGSNRSLPMRARLIVASNRALDQEAAAGRFRFDLYYRLNVIEFTLPPLRERRSLIAPIANQYIAEFAARSGRDVWPLNEEVQALLEQYSWPGNIRELRNVIERAVVLCPGSQIEAEHLPPPLQPAATCLSDLLPTTTLRASPRPGQRSAATATPLSLNALREEAEAACITEALDRHGNNRRRVAAELGISRMTLYKKLHKYGLMGAA